MSIEIKMLRIDEVIQRTIEGVLLDKKRDSLGISIYEDMDEKYLEDINIESKILSKSIINSLKKYLELFSNDKTEAIICLDEEDQIDWHHIEIDREAIRKDVQSSKSEKDEERQAENK